VGLKLLLPLGWIMRVRSLCFQVVDEVKLMCEYTTDGFAEFCKIVRLKTSWRQTDVF